MSDKKQGHDFSVGQKVRCIEGTNCHRLDKGKIYTVGQYTQRDDYGDLLSLRDVDDLPLGGWYASRFEAVEEEIDENAKKIKDTLDDLKAAFAEHWPELQAYLSETEKELALREERDHWKEQAEIARTKGEHKSDRISDLLRERDSLKKLLEGTRRSRERAEEKEKKSTRLFAERSSQVTSLRNKIMDLMQKVHWRDKKIAELESIILNQGLNKEADLLRERDKLRDEVETKDAIIAEQEATIDRQRHTIINTEHDLTALQRAVDIEDNRANSLKKRLEGTKRSRDNWKKKAERFARAFEERETLIRILREQLNDLLK